MPSSTNDLRELLRKLASSGALTPDFKVTATLRYPGFDEIDESELEDLTRKGLLTRRFVDMVIACPKCGSLNVSTKYVCPSCSSLDIIKSRLIQHVDCGYTDGEIKFSKKEGGALVCPKCGREIRSEKDLRVYATFFECMSCHTRTSSPNVIHRCHNCENIFTPVSASLRPIYLYELSDKGRELVKG